MDYKNGSKIAWGYQPKPLLYELSLKKSSIKNRNTIISNRVIIWIKCIYAPQKPNKSSTVMTNQPIKKDEQARCNWMTCFIGNKIESIRHQLQSTIRNQSAGAS